jgi:hypothetical protein
MVLGVDEPRHDSTAVLKMVSKSPRPVLIIQQKSEFSGYKNILFPLDDYITSRQKATVTARLALASHARVNLFSVQVVDATEKFKHAKRVEMVEEFFKRHDVNFVTEYASGNKKQYPQEVIDTAINKRTDLIIIMQRAPKVLAPLDPADKKVIFNEARIPVLCVNAHEVIIGGGMT